MKKRELKEVIWSLERRLEAATRASVHAEEQVARWTGAWHEGDAIRTKLQARIDELVGERRAANERARAAEEALAEARTKLGTVGWMHDELARAIPHWRRAFAEHAGEYWLEGKTTAPEQLRWALDYLRRRSA